MHYTILKLLLLATASFGANDCPNQVLPDIDEEQQTIDGITYTMGLLGGRDRFVFVQSRDNRETTSDVFFSTGMATIGHSNVFATQYAEYRMKVALPNGEYTLVDYSHKYHSRPLDICVGQDEVIVYMGESILGPDHYSYVWDFRVYVDAKDGDINDDGVIDGQDLAILLSNWGTENEQSDLNGDNVVNSDDLTILLANWN